MFDLVLLEPWPPQPQHCQRSTHCLMWVRLNWLLCIAACIRILCSVCACVCGCICISMLFLLLVRLPLVRTEFRFRLGFVSLQLSAVSNLCPSLHRPLHALHMLRNVLMCFLCYKWVNFYDLMLPNGSSNSNFDNGLAFFLHWLPPKAA